MRFKPVNETGANGERKRSKRARSLFLLVQIAGASIVLLGVIGLSLVIAAPGDDPVLHRFLSVATYVRKPGAARWRDKDAEIIADLERAIPPLMSEEKLVGLSVALVRRHGTVWSHAYGHADRAGGIPLRTSTPFATGSLSKIATALMVMRLHQQRGLDLDRDVDRLMSRATLPNPWRAESPVTLRGLLSHSGGIGDDRNRSEQALRALKQPIDGSLLQRIVAEHVTSIAHRPGSTSALGDMRRGAYSTRGYELIGAVVEESTGESFEQVARREVFDPLGMVDSTFGPQPEPSTAPLAQSHDPDGGQTMPRISHAHPGLSLVSTIEDLAKLARGLLLPQAGAEAPFLKPATLGEMYRPFARVNYAVNFGLGVIVNEVETGNRVWLNGTAWNTKCVVVAYPTSGLAAVAMTNSAATLSAVDRLMQIALEAH